MPRIFKYSRRFILVIYCSGNQLNKTWFVLSCQLRPAGSSRLLLSGWLSCTVTVPSCISTRGNKENTKFSYTRRVNNAVPRRFPPAGSLSSNRRGDDAVPARVVGTSAYERRQRSRRHVPSASKISQQSGEALESREASSFSRPVTHEDPLLP